MSHTIGGPAKGPKTGHSGSIGPSWDPGDSHPIIPVCVVPEAPPVRVQTPPRTLHHVTIRVPVMARNAEHAKTQAATMTVYGFGARANFEVLKVEAPDEH